MCGRHNNSQNCGQPTRQFLHLAFGQTQSLGKSNHVFPVTGARHAQGGVIGQTNQSPVIAVGITRICNASERLNRQMQKA